MLVPLVLAAGAKKNVLLITLDAFSGRDPWLQGVKTPNLDAIEHRGTRSATAASASLTLPMPSDPHTAHAPTPPRRGWGRNRSWWFLTHRRPWSRSWSTSAGWSRPGPCAHRFARAYVQAPQCCLTRYLNLSSRSTYSEKAYPPACPSFRHPFHKRSRSWGGGGVVGTHLGCCIVRHRACGGVVDRTGTALSLTLLRPIWLRACYVMRACPHPPARPRPPAPSQRHLHILSRGYARRRRRPHAARRTDTTFWAPARSFTQVGSPPRPPPSPPVSYLLVYAFLCLLPLLPLLLLLFFSLVGWGQPWCRLFHAADGSIGGRQSFATVLSPPSSPSYVSSFPPLFHHFFTARTGLTDGDAGEAAISYSEPSFFCLMGWTAKWTAPTNATMQEVRDGAEPPPPCLPSAIRRQRRRRRRTAEWL